MAVYRVDLLAKLTVKQLIAEYDNQNINWKQSLIAKSRGRGRGRGRGRNQGRNERNKLIASSPRPSDLANILNDLQPAKLTYPVAAVQLASLMEAESPQNYNLSMFDDPSADHISTFLNIYSIPSDLGSMAITYLLLILSYSGVISERDNRIIQTDYFIPLYSSNLQSLVAMAQNWSLSVSNRRSDLVRSLIEYKLSKLFPFNYLTYDDPSLMFRRLREFSPEYNTNRYRLTGYYSSSFDPRIALSINNVTNQNSIEPIYLSTKSTESMVPEFDGISDHFTENVRMLARRSDFPWSPMDFWERNIDWIKETASKLTTNNFNARPKGSSTASSSTASSSMASSSIDINLNENIDKYREVIWINAQWATRFKPSWAKFLILVLFPKPNGVNWLDISAGWGDRLITAISLDMNYQGYDPNLELKRGHDKMIEMFGDKNRHKVIYEPFETAILNDYYDVVLTSPPFFDLEIYSEQESQSISRYNQFNYWLRSFLLKSLTKAWRHLNPNGFMMIHISDSRYHQVVEPIYKHISSFNDSYYLGVIGLAGESNKYRPVWIWRKVIR